MAGVKGRSGRKAMGVPVIKKHKRVVPPRPVVRVHDGHERYQESAGAPVIELTAEEIGKLKGFIVCGTPMEECARLLGVSKDTLENRYMEQIKNTRADRNLRIRLKIFNLAMEGNIGALIWLSKQWCGMRDQVTFGAEFEGGEGGADAKPLIELVFVESDGDGRPKTIDTTSVVIEGRKALTDGANADS